MPTWVITELSQLATTYLRRLVCLTLRPAELWGLCQIFGSYLWLLGYLKLHLYLGYKVAYTLRAFVHVCAKNHVDSLLGCCGMIEGQKNNKLTFTFVYYLGLLKINIKSYFLEHMVRTGFPLHSNRLISNEKIVV